MKPSLEASQQSTPWLEVLRGYLAFLLLGNLAWETAHLPLYSLWYNRPAQDLAFAVAHCTLGDILIGAMSLVLSLAITGDEHWPHRRHLRVLALTMVFSASYTIFSEWLNLVVRQSWAYSPRMPVIPLLGVGLSPLLQSLIVPAACLYAARRKACASSLTGCADARSNGS